jgi:hypothetical protein
MIADDVLTSLTGKLDLRGVYLNDIVIHAENTIVNQLVAIFYAEGTMSDLPRIFRFEVLLPGETEPHVLKRPIQPGWRLPEGRERWFGVTPFPIIPARLRSGKIEARVLLDERIIEVAAPWIVLAPSSLESSSQSSENAVRP